MDWLDLLAVEGTLKSVGFKGLDLIDRVPEELWTGVHDIVQEERSERQRRRGKIHPSECRVLKNSKER